MRAAGPEDPDEGDDERDPRGRVQPTHPGALVGCGVAGLVVGWALRPLSLHAGAPEPQVSWLSIGLVYFVAAIIGGAAYQTWRTRREGHRLQSQQAVNRLVLGKACALAGAALAGGYFGYAVANLGVSTADNGGTRLWHSALAGAGGFALMAAALLLEQACRVRRDDD